MCNLSPQTLLVEMPKWNFYIRKIWVVANKVEYESTLNMNLLLSSYSKEK